MAEKKVAFKVTVMEDGKMEFYGPDDEKLKPVKDLEKIPKCKLNQIQTFLCYVSPCINGWCWIYSPITGWWYRVRC